MPVEWKRRVRAATVPLIFLSLTGYFASNAIEGAHGLIAYSKDRGVLGRAEQELAGVSAERARWETEVAALGTDHLDADLLDERARAMLNLVDPSDIVIPYPPGKKLY